MPTPLKGLGTPSAQQEGNPELDKRHHEENHRDAKGLETEGSHHQERQDRHHRRGPQQRGHPPLDQGPAQEHTSHDQPPVPTAEVLDVLCTLGIKNGQQQRGHGELPGQTTIQGGNGVG